MSKTSNLMTTTHGHFNKNYGNLINYMIRNY
jgi:hypothetical protein